jgi:undecaprenyl-diphosphatase
MDRSILLACNAMVGWPGVGEMAACVHWRGSGLVFAVLVLLWALQARRYYLVLVAVVAVAVTDPLCAQILKPLVARDRPYLHVPGLACPFGAGGGFSMPSNHAANAFALAAAFGAPWIWGVAVAVAMLRLVAGVHYPSDVLVGALIGGGVGYACRAIAEAVLRHLKARDVGRRARGDKTDTG